MESNRFDNPSYRTDTKHNEPVFAAHGPNSDGRWDTLPDHLQFVAKRAAEFAAVFHASKDAEVAGLLHDVGKFRKEFQEYLRKKRGGGSDTHHAVYGAALAFDRNWIAPAFSIAGHHAGLHDRDQLQALVEDRKYHCQTELPTIKVSFQRTVGQLPEGGPVPAFLSQANPHQIELYIRMVFSCLVDADYLETERHCSGQLRQVIRLPDVCEQLLARVQAERASKSRQGPVNQVRHAIFDQCLAKARTSQGFFSLTVPTGGGKTLSGMAFGLAHAKQWKLNRIIVVIPYLSIIEQNAAEYHRILDPDSQGLVVEHHSAIPVPNEGRDEGQRTSVELAAENWDAPIIVTTSVQFIESLFASSPSQCRKLHNLAGSVVILDEVQTLPTHLLDPLLNVVRELRLHYGVSFLFMTATQPAFRRNHSLPQGFHPDEVEEITADPGYTFQILNRVNFHREQELDWPALAQQMKSLPQALCVVNVRKHAFALWEQLVNLLPKGERDSIFHLSSALCAEHRLFALGQIKDPRQGTIRHRLLNGQPCRVVSTQVVEAGVDMDFPVVFRAMGPLDSIVQAAGRCNREGRLVDADGRPARGQVVIFTPQEHSLPKGTYRTATEHTGAFLQRIPTEVLGLQPDIFTDYFSQLFDLISTDYAGRRELSIQEDRENLRFREVSRKARVIRDDGHPVVVPYGQGKAIVEAIRERIPSSEQPRFTRHDLRRLQRFMVAVRTQDFQMLQHTSMLKPLLPNLELFMLEEGCYHEHLGLLLHQHPLEELCGV